jgi:TIR domain
MHEIFISYSRRDLSTVQALAAALSEKGLSVWMDRTGVEEGDAYDTQIEDAIAQTRVVIVVWSQHSIRSHWVRAEAAYALNKHKLLPISIGETQPPLQFMQIQTLDFGEWEGAASGDAFARLLSTLAKRLDRQDFKTAPGAADAALVISAPPERQETDGARNWIARKYIAAMVAVGLRFPEKVIEEEFQQYFRERMFGIAQFGILLAFIAYLVYGVSDMASDAAIYSTRFRYMVACPLLLIFYFASRTKFAKLHSQLFIGVFAIVLSVCVYITVVLLGIETPFRIQTGNGTMNFMLILGFLALLPLSLVSTALIGGVMVVLHALIMMETHIPLMTSWLSYLHVSSMWTVACCIAYWREHQQRLSFAAEMS